MPGAKAWFSSRNFFTAADHAVDRGGAVIGQEHHHRHRAAIGIEQAGVGLEALRILAQGVVVARQHAPADIAVVPAAVDDLGRHRQGDDLGDALDVAHVPGETVERFHHRIAGACRRSGAPSAITLRMSTPSANLSLISTASRL